MNEGRGQGSFVLVTDAQNVAASLPPLEPTPLSAVKSCRSVDQARSSLTYYYYNLSRRDDHLQLFSKRRPSLDGGFFMGAEFS
jgi:hypothetical protein